ncbi:hypothetical protein, partial [Pseudomonas urmiensis]|uniref:hypothetical protein n=1 Tax=Pseudomonas urmiensis TaxID=2745493 RepID=UPI0034D726D8
MKTLVAGTSNHSPDAAKATLRAEFEHFLETLSLPLLVELAEQEVEKRYFDALKMVLKREGQKALSPKVRNQLAYAKGKALAFKSVNEAYELLDSKTVCSLLGITRQALNKRVQTGQV